MRAYERLFRLDPSPLYETDKRENDRYCDYSITTTIGDTAISTAGISDVMYGRIAYINGEKITGVLNDIITYSNNGAIKWMFENLTPTADGCSVQPDIEDERNGALDEFLEEFKPQTTQERSDEQK